MRLRKKQRNLILFIIGIVVVIGILYSLGVFKPQTNSGANTLFIIPSTPIMYPLYASICCEEKGAIDWISATTLTSNNAQVNYACPTTTSQCKVLQPYVTCPGISWTAPLGFSSIWWVSVQIPGISGPTDYYHTPIFLGDKNLPDNGKEFSKGGTMAYRSACVNNAIALGGIGSILALFNIAQAPTTNGANVQVIDTQLYRYSPLSGRVNILNTPFCNQISATTNYKKNEPQTSYETNAETSANFVQDTLNLDSKGEKVDANTVYLKNSPNQLNFGDCSRTIEAWTQLPGFGNLNPKGKYNGNDVVCALDKGIIGLSEVKTEGGSSYAVPTTRLKSTGFCCSDGDCKYLGNDFNCEYGTYECKQVQGYCNSDLDCQPEGGIREDANCITKNGKFYTWISSCSSHKCVPYPPTETEVKCCASYCGTQGKICNYLVGCQDVIPPNQPCPPGECCDAINGFGFYPGVCNTGLVCCGKNQGVGTCKTNCSNGGNGSGNCASCIEWASNIFKSTDKCTPKGTEVIWWNPLSWFNATGLFSQNLWCPILLACVFIVGLFGFLFSLDFLLRFKSISGKSKGVIRLAIALIIAVILAYITYVAFLLGVICFIIFLVIKYAIGFILPTKYLSMIKR